MNLLGATLASGPFAALGLPSSKGGLPFPWTASAYVTDGEAL
jgi:hypothetical protein